MTTIDTILIIIFRQNYILISYTLYCIVFQRSVGIIFNLIPGISVNLILQ